MVIIMMENKFLILKSKGKLFSSSLNNYDLNHYIIINNL